MEEDKIRIFNTFCLWGDLLGFGKPFYDSNWKMDTPQSLQNLSRIISLQHKMRNISYPGLENALIINDGFIRTLDVPINCVNSILYWLESTIEDFYLLNRTDLQNGYPGLRGVLTAGQRAEYMSDAIKLDYYIQSSEERKKEYHKETAVYSPKRFQMNTAFSKASIIETSGSKYGVTGHNLYIDIEFIRILIELINNTVDIIPEVIIKTQDSETVDEGMILKYKADFIENKDIVQMLVKADNGKKTYDFFKINFANGHIGYINNEKSINTFLYIATDIWSCRESDFTFDLTDFN